MHLSLVSVVLLLSFDDGDFDDAEDEEPLDDLENVEDVRIIDVKWCAVVVFVTDSCRSGRRLFRVQWGLCPCTATLCVIVLYVRLSASNEDVNVFFLLHLSPTCVDWVHVIDQLKVSFFDFNTTPNIHYCNVNMV